jgi:ABC-2 type transport system ATP-binding protein
MLHGPSLLFLDEPTVGVDVATRRDIVHFLKKINASGTTIFYTSHQLNEAQELCNEVALISQGSIIARDSLHALLDKEGSMDLEQLFLERMSGRK